jgi:exodeoxyribonuclease-3
MKIVTWNVNSLNVRAELVGLYLDAVAPDVLCLQELKLPDDKVPTELFESRGYHVAVHGQKSWNGVLIASKRPLEEVHRGLDPADEGESRLISALTGGIRVVNLYCPQGQSVESPKFEYKLRFYDGLLDWLGGSCDLAGPLVLLGDLNIAPRPEDVWSPEEMEGIPSFHPLEHARWARLVSLGLEDAVVARIKPRTFTFWDYRGAAFRFNQGMRIDHLLVTAPLRDKVTEAWVDRDWRKKRGELKPSDHAPVGIALDWS